MALTFGRLLESASIEDMGRYFNNTLVNLDGKWRHVSQVVSLNGRGKKRKIMFGMHDGNHAYVSGEDSERLSLSWPEPGLYDWNGNVFNAYRRPSRQNRKGVCSDTMSILPLFGFPVRTIADQAYYNSRFGFQWGNGEVFELPKRQPLRQAMYHIVDKISKDQIIGQTLSRQFALTTGVETENPTLWFYDTPIGQVINPMKIEINGDLFYQEAIDFFLTDQAIDLYLKEDKAA